MSANCVIPSNAAINQAAALAITDAKLYVSVVSLSTQDNAKLLQQLKLDFKRRTNWNKYQSEIEKQAQNPYLNYLNDSSFKGINILFVLPFGINSHRTSHKRYFLPIAEMKDNNIMINGQNVFDQPIRNDINI